MAEESIVHEIERICQKFEESSTKDSIEYLSDLADDYLEKAEKSGLWQEYVKAHGLYNACGKREPHQDKWYQKAYDVECKYLCASNGDSSKMDLKMHQDATSTLKRSLAEIRREIKSLLSSAETIVGTLECSVEKAEERDRKKERDFCAEMKSISKICCGRMVSFASDVIASATKFCGALPCGYAVIAIGSMAKCEVTPYSDLEYFFLIEKEDYQCEFEKLAVISYFVINNLRESNLYIYNIEELKNHSDNTKCGFEIDGLAERAGNIPTGHGPGTSTNNKFIKTVEKMAELYEEILASPKGDPSIADLSAMLASTVFIYGNKDLHMKLIDRINRSEPNEARRLTSLKMLQEHVRKFNFLPDDTLGDIKHVKTDFFRFPSLLIYDLKIICRAKSADVWEVLEELRTNQNISLSVASSLECIMSAAQYTRLGTYLLYESQTEKISVLPAIRSVGDKRSNVYLAYLSQNLFLMMCLHLIPVKNMIAVEGLSLDHFLQEVPSDRYIAAAFTSFFTYDFRNCIKYFHAKYNEPCEITAPEQLWIYIKALKLGGQLKIALNCVQDKELMMCLSEKISLPLKGEVFHSMGMYIESLQAYLKGLELLDEWQLASALGNIYSDLGELEKSREYYIRAISMSGSEPDVDLMVRLLETYFKDYLDHGKRILEMFLKMQHNKYGSATSHLAIASSYSKIGCAYDALGEFNEAISYYERSLEITEKVYQSRNHPDVASSYNNIGAAYRSLGNYQQALSYHVKSMEIRKQVYGTTIHPDIAVSYDNIGTVHNSFGDYKKAIGYYEKSLELRKEVYGTESHPDIAGAYNNIGSAYAASGNYCEAISYFTKSLEIMMQVYGKTTHLDIAGAYYNLGAAYQKLGDCDMAIVCHYKSLEIRKQVYGTKNHPDIASSYDNIGSVCYDKDDYRRATLYYNKSLKMRKQVYRHSSHPDLANSYSNIGSVYASLGDYNQALRYYNRSLEIRKKVFGNKNHPDVAGSYKDIGMVLYFEGKLYYSLRHFRTSYMMVHQEGSAVSHLHELIQEILNIFRLAAEQFH